MSRLRIVLMVVVVLAVAPVGCSRQRYRMRADRDAYGLLNQQTVGAPWQADNFSIETRPDSRLTHSSSIDDPCLPLPAPTLYAYRLPETSKRDPSRFKSDLLYDGMQSIGENVMQMARRTILRLPQGREHSDEPVQLTGFDGARRDDVAYAFVTQNNIIPNEGPGRGRSPDAASWDRRVDGDIDDALFSDPLFSDPLFSDDGLSGRRIVPIAGVAWDSIPPSCLMRTLEFSSVRTEFERTYGHTPGRELYDSSERLALEDLLAVAILNSREYQSQKEQLYRAALRLSLERYDYQLKFTPSGNGVGVDWSHRNEAGITENSLGIATGAAVEKVMSTGGNLLARFANDVVLTFNGPNGFAADVGSELFAEITQPLLQRDIVFERLTQSERDVVYAARDYARFKKQFFRDIATDYYQLLLTYRNIEINMLDFFANQRGFDQAKNEYRQRQKLPRFQVDQFEQNALSSRSRVIRSCNDLEQSLDRLKLRLGIPPETPINLDLTELEILTVRDEITVAAELVSRAYRNLNTEVQILSRDDEQDKFDRVLVVNASIQWAQKLEALFQLQQQDADGSAGDEAQLRAATDLLNKLEVEAALIRAEGNRDQLLQEINSPRPPLPAKLTFLRMNLIKSLIVLARQQRLAYQQGVSHQRIRAFAKQYSELSAAQDEIYQHLSDPNELAKVAVLSERAGELLRQVESETRADERLDASNLFTEVLLLGEQFRGEDVGGLVPIELPADEAMLTGLVTRFDLMNERGALADAWRDIKLAGDDLRSVLNLRASQTIQTDPTVNRPFDFTFDESETQLGLTFDAPLNRRAQRNTYRVALINYNVALRNLSQLEDDIKFALRSDLRDLQLDREQYSIAVASAALASDRRLSTRKQLDVGRGNITARDFLEAQQAYTLSLNSVASEHIGYILDRIELFLDMELLQVDERGFWPQLYNESFQPEVRMQPPAGAGPAYGRLPSGVHYSDCIRRMDWVPFGLPRVFDNGAQQSESSVPQAAPTPDDTLEEDGVTVEHSGPEALPLPPPMPATK